jgi:hypothetical protein
MLQRRAWKKQREKIYLKRDIGYILKGKPTETADSLKM